LQLVQPLTPDHPLQAWLARNGPGLHHLCLKVEDVGEAMKDSPVPPAPKPHQGTQGKRAVFLDKTATQGVQVELTGK
jgi:methylmalonyl-CoA/ethylmalonyl-CoA epimerase